MDRRLFSLIELWGQISEQSGLSGVLRSMNKAAQSVTGAEVSEIVLAGEGWAVLEHDFATPSEIKLLRKLQKTQNQPIVVVATQKDVKLVFAERQGWVRPLAPEHRSLTVRNSIFEKISVDETDIGEIRLFNRAEAFGEFETEFLRMFIDQGASVIERELLKARITGAEKRLSGVFDAIADGILVLTPDGEVIFSNKAFSEMFSSFSDDKSAVAALIPSFLGLPVDYGSQELFLLKPHGRAISSRFVYSRSIHGELDEIILSFRDTTKIRSEERVFTQLLAMMARKIRRLDRRLRIAETPRHKRRSFKELRTRLVSGIVMLTDIKSGPLRLQKLPSDCDEVRELLESSVEKVFPVASIVVEPVQSAKNTRLYLDGAAFSRMLLSLLRFHRRLRGRNAEPPTISVKYGSDCVCLNFETRTKTWASRPDARLLDWRHSVELFISGNYKEPTLELSFARHIMEAHKGSFDLFSEKDLTLFSVELPLRG